MASKNGRGKVVPAETAQILVAVQARARALSTELTVLGSLARGYCENLGLDPDQPYDFTEEDGKVYAKVRTPATT